MQVIRNWVGQGTSTDGSWGSERGAVWDTHQLRAAHSVEPAGDPVLATRPDVVLKLQGQGMKSQGHSSQARSTSALAH